MKSVKKIAIIAAVVLMNSVMVSCSLPYGKDDSSEVVNILKTEEKTTEETSAEEETENIIEDISETAADKKADFVISKDILIAYNGSDSHVVIPDGVKKIDDSAFWSIECIEAVDIPESVEEIGEGAFWSCSALKYVNAAEGLKKIYDTAFWSCPSLKDVNLPSSVTEIGDTAFANCPALTIHTPEGSYAEEYAYGAKISSDNTYAEYTANTDENVIRAEQYEYEEFSQFIINDGVTAIEARAFQYCRKLETIDIPASVLTIGGDAFEYCSSLKSVNINEGCTEIGDGAFEYCESLTDVNIPASVEKIEKSSFDYCSENLVIHTPQGSYAEQYAKANDIAYDNVLYNDTIIL